MCGRLQCLPREDKGVFLILSCVHSVLTGLRVGFCTAINSNYLEGRSPLTKVAIGTGYRRNLKRRVTLFLNFTCIDLRVRTVSNYFQNRSPARCLGGHRFKSCRELRFFSLSHARDMLIISSSHLSTELKIYHLSFFHYFQPACN